MLNALFLSTHIFYFATPGAKYPRSKPPRRGIAVVCTLLYLLLLSLGRGCEAHLNSLNCCACLYLVHVGSWVVLGLVCKYCKLGKVPLTG
ncbi:unnamed protein product [Prunus armeniaca]